LSVNKENRGSRLAAKVTPNAGSNEITGFRNGVLLVKVAAPPDKGKANRELVEIIAEKLEIKRSAILIIKGQTSRHKTIIIEGMTAEELQKRLKQ
jgi:uncharacterized protein (TIGR00251 family)